MSKRTVAPLGAIGAFTVTNDITRYTNVKLFSEVGKRRCKLYEQRNTIIH
jgi:catalase